MNNTLLSEAKAYYATSQALAQQAVYYAALTGEKLNELTLCIDKAQGKAGAGFKAYLAKEWPELTYVTAMNLMRLPVEFPSLISSTNKSGFISWESQLSLKTLISLLSSPQEVKNSVKTKVENGEKVTAAQVADLNRQLKEAKLQGYNEAAQKHQKDLDRALSNKESLEWKYKNAELEVAKLKQEAVVLRDNQQGNDFSLKAKQEIARLAELNLDLTQKLEKIERQDERIQELNNALKKAKASGDAKRVCLSKISILEESLRHYNNEVTRVSKLLIEAQEELNQFKTTY